MKILEAIAGRVSAEPGITASLVRSLIICATAFGLRLSPSQIAGVLLVTETVLAWWTRSRTVPFALPPATAAQEA